MGDFIVIDTLLTEGGGSDSQCRVNVKRAALPLRSVSFRLHCIGRCQPYMQIVKHSEVLNAQENSSEIRSAPEKRNVRPKLFRKSCVHLQPVLFISHQHRSFALT